jgi:Zn-dependent membrane protease YugP
MFFDPLYLAILVGTLVLSGAVSLLVRSRFSAGQRIPLMTGMAGRDVARAVLRAHGICNVDIVEHGGFLSDHYNPLTRTLALSPDVYHGRDAAAAGVAAHEAGHAVQHARAYAPLWMRSAIVPAANIGSSLGPWIVIAGIFLGAGQGLGYGLAVLGVALFALSTLFTLVTLPVEFDASARAKRALNQLGIVRTRNEAAAVSGVLDAAGLTYVAAAASSLAMLFYWAMRAGLLGTSRE